MSHIERNLKWLNNRRVVYRQMPTTDEPSVKHKYYNFHENGTYQCYELFKSRAKITTYKSLKWHMLVLYYLNMDDTLNSDFVVLARFIADKENGFVTFFIKNKILENMIKDVLIQGGDPPKNKLRKVIFKDSTGLSISEKLSIVGKLIGRLRKVRADDIYECMLDMHDTNKKITWDRIAGLLDCSVRTIQRNLNIELKREKELLNKQII